MLEVKSLSKKYGKIRGAEEISFTLAKGEIVGFIGPNGAGKSTTMNMISGCLAADSGDAVSDGILMSDNPVKFRSYIGYLPERPPLYNEFTVREYLKLVEGMKKLNKKSSKMSIDEIIGKFGLSEVAHRVIGNLSKGYKQRIGLAQAFCGAPEYVILDEPTVGLDPTQKKQTLELIKSMKKHYGILLSSHILAEISFVCDRVIIINEGKIVKQLENESEQKTVYEYRITGSDKQVIEILLSCEKVTSVEKKNGVFLVETERSALGSIFYTLAEAKMPIIGLQQYHVDVEDEFMRATNKRGGKDL